MNSGSRSDALRSLIEAARQAILDAWEELPEEQRQKRGDIDRWAPKDHLAHLTFWNARTLARLEHILGAPPPEEIEAHFQETNERVFREQRERPAEEIVTWFQHAYDCILAALARLEDDVLENRERFPWTAGRPLWWNLVFTPVYHAIHHLCDVLVAQGDLRSAQALQEVFAEKMAALEPSPSWRGTVEYNQACFYALHGQPERALERLRSAFELNPGLIEWSQQDSDLDSLRALPTFQALAAGEGPLPAETS